MNMQQTSIAPGFSDLTHQSQQSFKAIMDAMAQPGKIYDAPHKLNAAGTLNPVAAMVALTFVTQKPTSIWTKHWTVLRHDSFSPFTPGPPLPPIRTKRSLPF